MPITNPETGTRIDEVADGIYRVSTPVPPSPALPPGFSFNQFLIVDEEPLLFHTGLRKMFPLTREAESEVLGPSEAMRKMMDYFAHGPNCRPVLERLAAFEPRLLACKHGSSYRGNGAELLRRLADALEH